MATATPMNTTRAVLQQLGHRRHLLAGLAAGAARIRPDPYGIRTGGVAEA
jgi:hypothetical protein